MPREADRTAGAKVWNVECSGCETMQNLETCFLGSLAQSKSTTKGKRERLSPSSFLLLFLNLPGTPMDGNGTEGSVLLPSAPRSP